MLWKYKWHINNANIFFPFMLRHLFRVGVCTNERAGEMPKT